MTERKSPVFIWVLGLLGAIFGYFGSVSEGENPIVALFLCSLLVIFSFGISIVWWVSETIRVQRHTLGRTQT